MRSGRPCACAFGHRPGRRHSRRLVNGGLVWPGLLPAFQAQVPSSAPPLPGPGRGAKPPEAPCLQAGECTSGCAGLGKPDPPCSRPPSPVTCPRPSRAQASRGRTGNAHFPCLLGSRTRPHSLASAALPVVPELSDQDGCNFD
jgi:hypothetical protein